MSAFSVRKNKIVLSDYLFHRDIESRLLLADLNQAEVALLNEIFNYSLFIPLADLVSALNLPVATINAMLAKFAPLKLCRSDGSHLILNKEIRRYFEGELSKFDEDFEPGMEYLRSLLNKVPPYVLPNWYALPRSCDRIFPAIVEKYFSNPKIYQRYLKELQFPHPLPGKIAEAVFSSPDLKVEAAALKDSLSISSEQFHEAILLLEFHLVCCLKYEREGDIWREIITPFHEWRDYLLFHQHTEARSIEDCANIKRTHPRDFGFVEDMTLLLRTLKHRPLRVEKTGSGWKLTKIDRLALFPHQTAPSYSQALIEKASLMHFAEIHNRQLIFMQRAEEWLPCPLVDKAMTMTRHPIQVEKGLRRVLQSGWVYVEDFVKGFTGAFRSKDPVLLIQKGKRWKYAIPEYNDEERSLIRTTLCERLFEAGIVATGTHLGKPCFCVTPFGISMF